MMKKIQIRLNDQRLYQKMIIKQKYIFFHIH